MCGVCGELDALHVTPAGTTVLEPVWQRPEDPGEGPAEVVFRRGAVYTMDPRRPWAQAVAVRGRRIVAVGSDDEVSATVGAGTRVVDLDGRMLLPGFVDAHIHPLLGAFFTAGADLQHPTREGMLAALADWVRAHPDGPVRGFGWRVDMFGPDGPHRAELDRIVGDRPAVLTAIDCHSAWVSSAALRQAGITRETPDPVPGFSFFQRDSAGEPTGYVLELPAVLKVIEAVEPFTQEAVARLFAEWAPRAAAAGLTAMFDAAMPGVAGDEGALGAVYTGLEAQGRLPMRVVLSHVLKSGPVDGAVAAAQELARRYRTELVRGGVLKVLGDGTAEGYTAHLLEPYADKPDSVGSSPFTEVEWYRLVREADAAGLDLHIHAIGDRTVRVALDALESAIAVNPARDRRHAIAHLVYVDEADLCRFGPLGVIAQCSGNWMSADPSTVQIAVQRYGQRRAAQFFRTRTLLDWGATIAFGTDWPAAGYYSTYKPLDAVQVAVTRQLIGEPEGPVLEPADERLYLSQALYAATAGAAYQLRLDDAGMIAPGMLADLVVLRENLFDLDPAEIASTPVDLTMMSGNVTYES